MSTSQANGQSGGPRRSQRVPKPTAKGREYRNTLARRLPRTQTATQPSSQTQPQNNAATIQNNTSVNPTNGQPNNSGQSTAVSGGAPGQAAGAVPSNNIPTVLPTAAPSLAPWRSGGIATRSAPVNAVATPTPKRSRATEGLLIKIYEELHCWATANNNTGGTKGQADIRDFLFRARVCRFFDLLPGSRGAALEMQLTNYVGDKSVDAAKASLDPFLRPRLLAFCHSTNLLLLTICAHSKSFREVIRSDDDDKRDNGEATWDDIQPEIRRCRSSLELFAQCYACDWLQNLSARNSDISKMLTSVYSDRQRSAPPLLGKSEANLGIAPSDLRRIHEIPADREGQTHHHWALPRAALRRAVRPTIKYTVTADTARAPFVNDFYAILENRGKGSGAPSSPVQYPVGSAMTLRQLNIRKSVFLANQPWPAGSSNDCSGHGNPCVVCGKEKPLENRRGWKSCACVFAKLMAKENSQALKMATGTLALSKPENILVELYTTPKMGFGVRSLRYIPKQTYIANYVGEIYPERDADTDADIIRYGPPQGNKYHFTVAMGPTQRIEDPAAALSTFSIDSAHLGNWTRFMNHSCHSNVEFSIQNIGQTWHVLCRTTRQINFGDELMVDYGRPYFEATKQPCLCKHPTCKYPSGWQKRQKSQRSQKRKRGDDDSEDESVQSLDQDQRGAAKVAKKAKSTSTSTTGTTKSTASGKAAKKGAKRRR